MFLRILTCMMIQNVLINIASKEDGICYLLYKRQLT